MIAKRVDERHTARGYDPYNSADQPHVWRAMNEKEANRPVKIFMPAKLLVEFQTFLLDRRTDAQMRRGFQHLARHGYEFFPGTAERRKFP